MVHQVWRPIESISSLFKSHSSNLLLSTFAGVFPSRSSLSHLEVFENCLKNSCPRNLWLWRCTMFIPLRCTEQKWITYFRLLVYIFWMLGLNSKKKILTYTIVKAYLTPIMNFGPSTELRVHERWLGGLAKCSTRRSNSTIFYPNLTSLNERMFFF